MTLLCKTITTSAIMIAAMIYIIRLFKNRKSNLDFPNHLFVSGVVLLISAGLTIIQLYDLTMKWTDHAPTIEGSCTIDLSRKETAINFEEQNQYLSGSRWIDVEKYGQYATCKATYYPITKGIIDLQYENYIGPLHE